MADEMQPLYLIAGTDGAKIDATRARLRARAEREGGSAALEVFEPGEGKGMPDHEALLAAIPAMSLMDSRRYLLADGIERWRDKQLEPVLAALGELPPDLTLVLICRDKPAAKLVKAVKAASGEVHEFEAPKAREMPRVLVGEAQRLGFRLDPAAARMLVERMGANPVRLRNELERLALWAGEGGEVDAADLTEMIADTSEAAVWSLSDALIEGDAAGGAADRRAADRPGGERHRPDLRPRLAPAQRLRRRGPAGGGDSAEAGRVVAENAPLRGEAAGRAPAGHRPRRACAWRRRRWPTSSSGAAAAPTTATSWR